PNIIADEPVVPEYFNEFVRPGMLARNLERLMKPGSARQAQLDGFDKVASIMATEQPAGQIGARGVLELAGKSISSVNGSVVLYRNTTTALLLEMIVPRP